jgi:hypothetical protein
VLATSDPTIAEAVVRSAVPSAVIELGRRSAAARPAPRQTRSARRVLTHARR